MKKALFCIVLSSFLFFPLCTYADNFYFTLRPTFSLENFNLRGLEETIDKDESFGFNAKLGYVLGHYVSLELDYDYLFGFEGFFEYTRDDVKYLAFGDVTVTTIMPIMKTAIGSDRYKNYFSTGIGYMRFDFGEALTDACWKAGIGLEYFLHPKCSVGTELNYVVGFGDVKEVEYYNLAAGFAFLF